MHALLHTTVRPWLERLMGCMSQQGKSRELNPFLGPFHSGHALALQLTSLLSQIIFFQVLTAAHLRTLSCSRRH